MPSHWDDIVKNLNVWKRRGERAPHKPLLLLMVLSQAQGKQSNEFRFANIHSPLQALLREFGPTRKSYHPEFPFWHLQSDGCWAIADANALCKRKGKVQVTRKELLSKDAVAHVPEPLWQSLMRSPKLLQRIAQEILDEFWPPSLHQAVADMVGLALEPVMITSRRRQRDPRFRKAVFKAYEGCCAVCGYDARIVNTPMGIEAAHIQWHAYDGPDVVSNGVALCSLHHVAFDYGAISIGRDLCVLISKDLTGQASLVEEGLLAYHGHPIRLPRGKIDEPWQDYTRWHRSHVFKGPPRS